jgi:ankyrin repeat protein/catechol 2,3-dioxygenase-like lactoylglutathione lyase family enzyme
VAREHGFGDFAAFEAHLKALETGAASEPFRDAFKAILADDPAGLTAVLDAHPEIVNARGANGNRLLNLVGHRLELMQLLLARGADPNLGNNKGSTPLHDAAYGGGGPINVVERIDRLLAAGADPTLETYGEGGTPLAMALFWGHRNAARRLAKEGVTPCNLRTCAGLGRIDLMEALFEPDGRLRPEAGWRREFHRPHSGFPPWRPSDDRQEILDEALTYAARNSQVEAMDFLVKRGADVNAEPYCGTPLAWAVRADFRPLPGDSVGPLDAATWLLDHGADVNRVSNFGGVTLFTPLHLAAAWDGKPDAARLLLERGADVNAWHAEYNATPLTSARFFKNPEVEKVIKDWLSSPQAGHGATLIRPFVPCADLDKCKRFYDELGFTIGYDDGNLAVLNYGELSFYLQKGMWGGAAENYMLLLRVDDVEAWWRKVQVVAGRYGVKTRPPQDEPWGARNLHVLDPSGVLWHIAQFK